VRGRGGVSALAGLTAVYLIVTFAGLDTLPPVHGDESWGAAASFKLARTGTYGSDLFTGHYGAERHLYMYPPLYMFTVAASFRLFGVGVLPMRLPAVACGLAILLLTYAAGRRAGGPRVGLLAAFLLLFLRLAAGWDHATGVPLLDLARISRYDILVPVFGLLALVVFDDAERRRVLAEDSSRRARAARYLGTGILIGLSSLSHLYGAFLLPALLLVMLLRRGASLLRAGDAWLLLAGFTVAWLPWLTYIATGWEDFLGQQRSMYAGRYSLGDPGFYVSNLVTEVYRYRQLAPREPQPFWFARQFGTWVAVIGVPVAAMVALLRARTVPADAGRVATRAARADVQLRCRDTAVFTVALALVVQAALFALLLSMKMYNYVIALWPLAILLLAWGTVRMWDTGSRGTRILIAVLLAAVFVEGTLRIAARHGAADHVTSYDEYMRRVVMHVPPGARVLGMPRAWLGLHDHEYRAWLLPFFLSQRAEHPVPLADALERTRADVVLVDDALAAYFDELRSPVHPRHEDLLVIQEFLTRHSGALVAEVSDTTYGAMRVYGLRW
jgi:4-amino-4-deoxy-L-arabinose transferase-like glycosyltransferase